MQEYIQNYLDYHGFAIDEFIPCEVCGARADDIHHIVFRSALGTDDPENLIGVCRSCHDRLHMKKKPYITAEQARKYKKVPENKYEKLFD